HLTPRAAGTTAGAIFRTPRMPHRLPTVNIRRRRASELQGRPRSRARAALLTEVRSGSSPRLTWLTSRLPHPAPPPSPTAPRPGGSVIGQRHGGALLRPRDPSPGARRGTPSPPKDHPHGRHPPRRAVD